MSGGALDYAHSKLRHSVVERIKGDDGISQGVSDDGVEWDVEETVEYLEDLADLLRAYEWWKSADTREESYREVERKFIEKWE